MSQIVLSGVEVRFGADPLLRDVNVTVGRREHWGIVGRNGKGKTTLFRLIAGRLEPSAGTVSVQPDARITLLDQHREFDGATTVWDAAAEPYAELLALEKSLAEQARAIEQNPTDKAMRRYDRDLERFQQAGGYEVPARVDAVLDGLGFDPQAARSQPLAQLSGGERGRVGLARQLVAPTDILLLDEPTNHLDLATTRWLEDYLLGLDATVLVISHDRAFLERIVDHVLHVEAGTATAYTGSYADFVRQRQERRLAQQRAFEKQQAYVARQEEYIRRNIAGQNSRQAKGRRTRLERMPRLSPPPEEEGVMGLRLEAAERGGDQVLVAEDVRLEVDGRVLVDGFSTRLLRGEVVGLVGPNGAGKSTLLRAIAGERELDGGTLRLGASIHLAYYRQDLAHIPETGTLFDAIQDLRPRWGRGQVQAHLGRFGFSGDEVRRAAGTLSGGEQARLALAMMMLTGANLLLLDEPTNHLDVESIEALEDAVDGYDGTVVLVSHDRALLRALATRIWALEDGRVREYPGGFADWERKKAEEARAAEEAAAAEEARRKEEERRRARQSYQERKERRAVLRRARREVEAREARVVELEERIAEVEATLRDPSLYDTPEGTEKAHELDAELSTLRGELDEAMTAWTEAAEALEELTATASLE